jgi:hypothetical protein
MVARTGGTTVAIRTGHDQLFVPGDDGQIAVWDLDPVTGVPTEATAAGSPFDLNPSNLSGHFDSPVFSPSGHAMYIAPNDSGSVFGVTLDAAGVPTAIGGSPWSATGIADISCEVMSRDGSMIIAVGESESVVAVFKLNGDTPSQVVGSPFAHTTPETTASGLAISF